MAPLPDAEPATERKLRSSTRNPRRRQRQSDNDTLKTTAPRRKRSKISEDTFKPRDSTELPAADEDDDGNGYYEYNNSNNNNHDEHEQEHEDEPEDNISVALSSTTANGHTTRNHTQHSQQHHRHPQPLSSRKGSITSTSTALVSTQNNNYNNHSSGSDLELAFRGGRSSKPGLSTAAVKRALRGDGATILTQNAHYSVKLLPSTPKELRRAGTAFRGSLGEGAAATLAVAVSRERATVWEYGAHAPAANARVFEVPFATNKKASSGSGGAEDDPLPFAALVGHSAGSPDVGLLLLAAGSGKAVFYESIDRAASFGLFSDRKPGVEGNVGGLFSGETVVDLLSADHAGFLVVLSSGRIAQMTLRDAQGKAKISAQFLRAADPNSGGLFGSLKGLWNGGLYIRNLAAVRVRPLGARGQMQVVALNERAEVLLWDIDWSGRSEYRGSFSLREALLEELRSVDAPELAGRAQTIAALDFAIVDSSTSANGNEVAVQGAGQPLGLTVLLATGSADMRDYLLAELTLVEERVLMSRLTPITSYHGGPHTRIHRRPQILLPRPGHTAYVVFEDALVVVMSKDEAMEGLEAQLSTAQRQSTFEDVIFLRDTKDLAIQNASSEDARSSQSSCVAFVKSAGLVRISAHDLASSSSMLQISAKTRIEQAVFHGVLQDNILDFSRRNDTDYDISDVEDAVLAISDEILRATSSFVKPSPTSMEQHLSSKSRALNALVAHVRQSFPALSPSCMWRLLCDAERVAAGQQLWRVFEEHIAATSKGKRKATLLDELCAWFDSDENEQFPHRRDVAGEEPVRRFFIAGLHRLEKLLGHTRTFLHDHQENLRSESAMAPNDILQLVVQVNDVWLRTLETVFAFRTEHAAAYGIVPEFLDDGILTNPAEYTGLGEFWTSTEVLVSTCLHVATLSREFATKIFEKEEASSEIDPLVRKISLDNPRLVQLYCLMAQEGINWRFSRSSDRDELAAQSLQETFDATRYDQFRALAEVGQVDAGMALAEKYRDMQTLTDMVVAEDQYLEESSNDPTLNDNERETIAKSRQQLEVKIRKYFDRYGDAWADAFFDMAFSGTAAGVMLSRAQQHWRAALTRYLQARPSRAKICWINDVTEEHDFVHAGSVLAQAAKDQESRLWAKKVELSMSKLALMAAEEATQATQVLSRRRSAVAAAAPAQELIVADVQDRLYKHILPEILGCIDRQAELEICMHKYGSRIKDLSALRQLLEQGFRMILDHTALSIEELIDVLTLMDSVNNPEIDGNFQGAEFYFALLALNAAATTLPPAQLETLLQLVWKRCYIYDDWSSGKFTGSGNSNGSSSGSGSSSKQQQPPPHAQSDDDRRRALRSTAIWHTAYHALDAAFFDRPDCRLRPLSPRDCLGSVCAPEDLAHRFPNDDLLDPILHDLRIQDELLASFVADRRLDDLAAECRRDAAALLHEQADERARMLAAERAIERAMQEADERDGDNIDDATALADGAEDADGGIGAYGDDEGVSALMAGGAVKPPAGFGNGFLLGAGDVSMASS